MGMQQLLRRVWSPSLLLFIKPHVRAASDETLSKAWESLGYPLDLGPLTGEAGTRCGACRCHASDDKFSGEF